jgi:hypothetical protein
MLRKALSRRLADEYCVLDGGGTAPCGSAEALNRGAVQEQLAV